tara:strand:+ start:2009 stop:2530 length:522 start_codon:yes stop_codon:yes gene_type:complete
MKSSNLALDIGIGLFAGFATTKVTEYAQQALWKVTPGPVRQLENQLRPGPPFRVAAEKTSKLAGFDLDDKKLQAAGMAFHYASDIGWGPVYCLMRRSAGMETLGAGVATGLSMSIILDEVVTPAFGFSAPNKEYPTVTHLRGLLGHLVYGLTLAGTAEALYHLAGAHDADRHH